MTKEIQKLKISLEEKTPSLLLGAGFSFGGVNGDGDKLPLGEELVKRLYIYMFEQNPPEKEMFEEDKTGAEKLKENCDLKGLCSLLRDEGRLIERNDYLTTIFKGANIDQEKSNYYITDYKWNKIFTLNIDDLLEDIFSKKNIRYKVWNNNNDDRRNSKSDTLIIKLHGCVNNKDWGYVFDEKEYIDFLNEDNCFLRDFADAYAKGDMIFIGTEFQENDLKSMIGKYDTKGYDTSGNNYFFIMPDIKDPILKRHIKSKDNFYWIPWTTENFFDFLHTNIISKKKIKKELKEKGLIAIDDLYKEMDIDYESKIYTGSDSRFDDFFSNWDILHPGLELFEKKLISKKKNIVAAVIGKSYVGKTCVAKRILIDLRNEGYLTFQFNMTSSEYMQLFLQYLKQMTQNIKVAVLFEQASFYYNMIYQILFTQCPDNIEHLIVITSETNTNHYLKKDVLSFYGQMETFKVTEKISWTFAENLYTKLEDKHWLNQPELSGSSKQEVKAFAVQVNDIIEVLYNISHGKGFEQHYLDMFLVTKHEVNNKYLQALAILGVLGINSIPKRIFPSILSKYRNKFELWNFKNMFEELIVEENYCLKLRCLRLIQSALISRLDKNEIKDILYEMTRQTSGQFNEGDINEWSEIFQKSLTVKLLLQEDILNLNHIRDLFNKVERYGKEYSFYWIQRGIAAQKDKEYELADNYFRKAIKIRSNSYQAHHALAKNLLERGIDEATNGNNSYAPHYMQEGRKVLKNIIENPAYSRGLKYSIHTYIDMNIKYYEIIQIDMLKEEAEYIQDQIVKLSSKELDYYIGNAIKCYIEYCNNHNMHHYSELIIARHYDKVNYIGKISEKDYLIENLDWE